MNSSCSALLYRWFEILRCPQCRGHFAVDGHGSSQTLRCLNCATSFAINDGIPRLLKTERARSILEYCRKYDHLRLQEGWASTRPEFYLRLPFEDQSGKHTAEWQLRAKSFQQLQKWMEEKHGRQPLRILDAGAGSGWMSRLLATSHEVLATDVNAGPHGLEAHSHALRRFMAVQAESDTLPLATHSFDLIVANASAHYANDIEQFLAEATRVLRPGGELVIMDSPVYPNAKAVAAAHERTRAYYAKNGMPELAQNYSGLAHELFIKPSTFRFTCRRGDFSGIASLKKWLREKLVKESAARFPIWIGERMRLPEEDFRLGRSRAGAVIIHDNKLLTYFFQNEEKQYWRIPGGGIESNETPEQTVVRELREELGLHLTLQRGFGPYLFKHKMQWYFLAEADAAQLPHENTTGFEMGCTVNWLPLERLAEFDIRPAALKWELVEYFHAMRNR